MPRRFKSVAVRLLGAVLVPLLLLGLVTTVSALEDRSTAASARALAEHVALVDELVVVNEVMFSERIQAQGTSRASMAGEYSDLLLGYLDTDELNLDNVRNATDAALDGISTDDRPFDMTQLVRVRESIDRNVWIPSIVDAEYDKLQTALNASLHAELALVERHAVTLGDADLVVAVETIDRSVDAMDAAAALVADLTSYWFAAPFEESVTRSELARSEQRWTTAVEWLETNGVGDAAAGLTEATRFGPDFDIAVQDAIEGVESPLTTGQPFEEVLLTIGDGVIRSRQLTEAVPLASADVRMLANNLADDAARDADRATQLAVGALIVSILAALAFGRSIVKPVRRVTEHARRIGAGDIDVEPLPLIGPPELIDASGAFNDMLANLQLLERKAHALADTDLDASVLDEPLAGKLGESLHQSVQVLSFSIAERERLRSRLAFQASHDALTGIPNRSAAIDYLERACARASSADRMIGVVFIDLDDFKRVNDTHGHPVGDEVLRVAARRMSDAARGGDLLARIGGDEFLLVAEDLVSIAEAEELAHRIVNSLSTPIRVDGLEFAVGACAGIAVAEKGDDPLTLLRDADLAAYNAKRRGPGGVDVYDEALQRELVERADIEDALATALRSDDQLRLEYQPIVDAATSRLTGIETLLRWERPGHGRVAPDVFIPIAEASKLIIEIDTWVLQHATEQLVSWRGIPELDEVSLSINVSGRHILDSGFVSTVADALERSGCDPRRLIIEVTETVLVTDLEKAAIQLSELRGLGVRVAVDDFGTGYTSLAHLRSLPIDEIKIDRSFVSGLPEASDDLRLIQIVCDLAGHLGVPTVAEGVETEAQRAVLEELGCDFLQGYLFSPSMRPDALCEWAAVRSEPQLVAPRAG